MDRSRKAHLLQFCLWATVSAGLVWPSSQMAQVKMQVQTEPKQQWVSTGPGDFRFDATRHSIALDEIHGGGPPKDGIPALVDPSFNSPVEAKLLRPKDLVLGISIEGVSKAYPVRILNWHELVNDRVGSHPVLVTW